MALAAMKLALASLEEGKNAEPVAKVETIGVCWYEDNGTPRKPAVGTELYTAPPAPMLPEGLLSAMDEVLRISDRDHEAWNKAKSAIADCRAAMLQGAEQTNYRAIVERIAEIVHGKVTDIDLLTVTVKSMKDKLQK
ncbi:hypothetical protein ACV28B_000634 [Enterobacter hormaechei]